MTATHIDEGLLIGYRDMEVTAATAAAVEAHLMSCGPCRRELATVAIGDGSMPTQSAMWDAILERVDRPSRSVMERLLAALGIREDVAKLLATTPALRAAWFAAVVLVAALALTAASIEGGDLWPLLVVAPLLPVAGVATAYGPALDPTYEVALAAPMSTFRLTMLRTLAVIATTLPLLLLATVLGPGDGLAPFGWVLPAGALVSVTLALSTWMSPERAGLVAVVGWLVAVIVLLERDTVGDFLTRSLIFHSSGQTGAAVLMVAGAAVVSARLRSFDQLCAIREEG